MPVLLRCRRGSAAGSAFGDGRGRQTAQVSDHLQYRGLGGTHEDGSRRRRRIRFGGRGREHSAGTDGMPLLKVSSKTGAGMDEWLLFLAAAHERFARVTSAATADARRPL